MFERVLNGVPQEYKKNFSDNVMAFRKAWAKEVEIRSSIKNKQLDLITVVEGTHTSNSNMMESVLNIHKESPAPMTTSVKKFKKSLSDRDTILITLRLNNKDGEIVGYANGGRKRKRRIELVALDCLLGFLLLSSSGILLLSLFSSTECK